MKNELLKYLIIVTLCYYLLKGLIYLLLWQTTKKVQENALAAKQKEKEAKEAAREERRQKRLAEQEARDRE